MMRKLAVLAALWLAVGVAGRAAADVAVYTFESPQFTTGQATPLLDVAPNSGPSTFLASFTSARRCCTEMSIEGDDLR